MLTMHDGMIGMDGDHTSLMMLMHSCKIIMLDDLDMHDHHTSCIMHDQPLEQTGAKCLVVGRMQAGVGGRSLPAFPQANNVVKLAIQLFKMACGVALMRPGHFGELNCPKYKRARVWGDGGEVR